MNNKRKIAFLTLGCKLNYAETSTIARQFPENKFERIDFKEKADIYVINSCCVTENTEKKCHQYIRQVKKRNPDAVIAVVGCYAQLNASKISEMEGVNLVLGNEDKFRLYKLLEMFYDDHQPILANTDINTTDDFKGSFSSSDRTRSFLKVQDGCNYFCSYCTVPYLRGRSRSQNLNDILTTVNNIHKLGVREIVLTGINIGDYKGINNEMFIDLLYAIENKTNIERVRISSIEPDLLSDDIIELVSKSGKLMPHFHIPLQSANNVILKKMNRKYSVEYFTELINKIKSKIPHCCIATDIIVGFPGESHAFFEDSFHYIENAPISYVHVFTYSERSNTTAYKFKEVVKPSERKRRSIQLHQLSERKKIIFYEQNKNRFTKVLFESEIKKGFLSGFSDNYIRVKTKYEARFINQIILLKLINMDKDGIYTAELMNT